MAFLQYFLNFDKMISTIIIKGIYWILLAVAIISGFVMLFKSFFIGLLMLIFGPILVRVYAELTIILFSIHDNLVKIRLRDERK